MNTESLNLDSVKEVSDEKSEKTAKAKQMAANAGKFAAAAGAGATAMYMSGHETDIEPDIPVHHTPTPGHQPSGENVENASAAEEVTEFDPNDIMIDEDDIDVVMVNDGPNSHELAENGVEPITMENIDITPGELIMVDVEDFDSYIEDIDVPYLADNDGPESETDIYSDPVDGLDDGLTYGETDFSTDELDDTSFGDADLMDDMLC